MTFVTGKTRRKLRTKFVKNEPTLAKTPGFFVTLPFLLVKNDYLMNISYYLSLSELNSCLNLIICAFICTHLLQYFAQIFFS